MSLRPVSSRLASRPLPVLLAAWSFAVLLAACTSPTQWQKPGATDEMQARDVDACRRRARDDSLQELNARVLSQPYGTGVDPRGHATLAPPLAAEGDRVMIEQVLMQNCMRTLGYQLAPRARSPYAPDAR